MLEPYRSEFNERFTSGKYTELLARLNAATGTDITFRISETPCFFAPELMQSMIEAGRELTAQLMGNAEYLRTAEEAIPEPYRMPGCDRRPDFMTVDFGLVDDGAGGLSPKLVELQAFPSIFGYQVLLADEYKQVFDLEPSLTTFFNGMTEPEYWRLLKQVIVGEHATENVVLAEVHPDEQKTLPDFRMHERGLGIETVDVTRLTRRGRELFYRSAKSGREVKVERIYNRAIVDEILREGVELPYDYRDDLDVEWAGHPNWYFKVSKLSLPYLSHETVPPAILLDDWFAGQGRDRLPDDPARWILKPLYSFAGKGIEFAPSERRLAQIPERERGDYLLQERVQFVPVIRTPEGMTQAEIRILYVWPKDGELTPMISLVRMGRGLMMGVDHNRDRSWVGGSAALMPVR